MGMYDVFRLDNIELPDLTRARVITEYQTKQLQCRMDQFRVTHDGRLVRKRGDRDDPVYYPVRGNLTVEVYAMTGRSLRLEFAGGRLMTIEFIQE